MKSKSPLLLKSPSSCNRSKSRSNSIMGSPDHATVASDLLAALEGDGFFDVYLTSSDGHQVPACRFVLAARSKVLHRMLYGSFREAKSSTICMMGYDSCILRAIVYFCSFNKLQLDLNFGSHLKDEEKADGRRSTDSIGLAEYVIGSNILTEDYVRRLVQLAQAADYLELPHLINLAETRARCLMAKCPPLACAIFDEAIDTCSEEYTYENINKNEENGSQASCNSDDGNSLFEYALRFIECRPYATLDSDNGEGGITAIQNPLKLRLIMQSPYVSASESFLFQMLRRWREELAPKKYCIDTFNIAKQCTQHIQLHNIEPNQLLMPNGTVRSCDFVTRDQIFNAVAQQALRASQDGVWHVRCRPGHSSSGVERVLVEGAGSRDVNGMYYRIAAGLNLAHAELYSKREVACGQPVVYTLSCCNVNETSTEKENRNSPPKVFREFRLFSSKFLTHRAVRDLEIMQSTSNLSPVFQPVLQVLDIAPPDEHDLTVPTPIRKYYRVRLSDGDWHMPGTLARELNSLAETGEINTHHAIKVLEFGLYQVDGSTTGIHVIKATVVTTAPAQPFGDPHPLEQRQKSEIPFEVVSNNDKGLQSLYTCRFLLKNEKGYENKVPRSGWQIADNGIGPVPSCTWIPAMKKELPFNNIPVP